MRPSSVSILSKWAEHPAVEEVPANFKYSLKEIGRPNNIPFYFGSNFGSFLC